MNKHALKSLIIVLCFFSQANAQIAYYDAVILRRHVDQNQLLKRSSDSVFMILDKYIQPNVNNTKQQIIDSVNETSTKDFNPFLEISGGTEADINALAKKGGVSKALSTLGGLDVTNVANAVADIMIEHAKQELTVAFFDRFKEFVRKNPEFRILFPKTTDNLENLLSYKYPEMLPALRTSFLDDLRMITFRLDDVLELPRYKKLFQDLPEIKIAIRSLRLVQELETGASNAADVIKEFSEFSEWDTSTDQLKYAGSSIKLTAFLSESVRSNDKEEVWVSARDLKQLFYDEILFKIYMGLIYQKAVTDKTLVYYSNSSGTLITQSLSDLLREQKANIHTFQYKLKEFFDLMAKVNVSYNDLKNKINQKQRPANDDYYNYINTSLDVVEYGFSLIELFGKAVQKQNQYISLLRESNDLYRNIYTEEYNQAIVNVLDIFSKIHDLVNTAIVVDVSSLEKPGTGRFEFDKFLLIKDNSGFVVSKKGNENIPLTSFKNLDTLFVRSDSLFLISSTKRIKDPLDSLISFLEKVKPYALFIANMVEAKSEEEIKNALENAILPVGSSSIKKHSIFNISIQSYLGVRRNQSIAGQNAWANSWGITAPVGVAFSWGLGGNGNVFRKAWKPGSFSLFASVFDIGAIIDYKITADSTQDYEIKLGQIISPGGYAVLGFPWGLPLSFGIGGQYGPGIFKTDNGIQTITPDWRFNLFLAVDIPFFTIHNRVKNVKRK